MLLIYGCTGIVDMVCSEMPPNKKILIAEDEAIVAMGIQDTLKSFGYGISGIVQSGEEVFRHLAEEKPDLLIMDINLKGDLNGIETAEKIKSEFDIPVIFLTAYSKDEIFRKFAKNEPFRYLNKPCRPSDLFSEVESAIADSG